MASGMALDWAWVLYCGDQMLWRQRRIIGRVAATHGTDSEVYVVVSPDGNIQVEDFSGEDSDIAAVRYAGARTDVVAGVLGCLLYKFDEDIAAGDMVEYRRVAAEVSEEDWVRRMPGQALTEYMSAITVPAPVIQGKPVQRPSGVKTTPDRDERMFPLEFRPNVHRLRLPWRDVVEQLS